MKKHTDRNTLHINSSTGDFVIWEGLKLQVEVFNNYSSRPHGSESIAHEAEGRMGYWLKGHEGERNNCFSKMQLVGQKYRE